jgi:lipopolysaccharide/colanic/teichoic acid biosynthesis glycosyltransferase
MSTNGPLTKRPPKANSTALGLMNRDVSYSAGPRAPWMDRKPAVARRKLAKADREQPASARQWRIAPAGNRAPSYLIAKRIIDVVGAIAILVMASPLLLIMLAMLLVTTKGHPFFCQERLGFLGRPFLLYKFRTMVLDAERLRWQVVNEQDGPVFKSRTDPRITRLGKFLRKTSIDELPQLLNVIRGEMSLIGPRPPLLREVEQYKPLQRKRLAVMPGLTCLWQVSGRSDIGFARWMQMDLWYVKHQSLLTDLVLLLRTPWAVISRRGAH